MKPKKNLDPKPKEQPVTIRFPLGLVPRLDKAAKEANRSRNSEIVYRLASSFAEDGLAS